MKKVKKFLLIVLATLFTLCDLAVAPASAAYSMPYYIEVDLTNQIVTIYNTADKSIARQCLCSTGMNDATITGVWYMPERENSMERKEWYYFRFFHCYAKWATRYYYNYFFHSITFNDNRNDAMNAKAASQFGVPASHGCIRMRVEDAEFIAKNCLKGTRVEVLKSGVKDEDLRQLLYISSYTGEDGMTYSEFLGVSEDALGRGSTGSEVSDLQTRMTELGYYEGGASGTYDNAMVSAVKNLQKDLGLAETGITSKELEEVIFSDEAPVSAGQITISEGMSGPVVKKLQEALTSLGLYSGAIDSIYDVEVSDAVKTFQQACGYDADGVATAEVQQAIYYEVNKITEELGEGEITAEVSYEEVTMAKVSSDSKIIVRAQPSTESAEVGKVSDGDTLTVTAVSDGWAAVTNGSASGYVKTKYLQGYTETNPILTFTSSSGESVALGTTLAQKQSGVSDIKTEISEYYANEEFMGYLNETVTFCTVNTGSDDVSLNLRAEASSDGEILAKIPNGTKMRVLSSADGWTKVGYDEEIGYLMDEYLTFSEGLASEVESTAVEKESSELSGGGIVLGEGYDVVEGTEDQLVVSDGETTLAVVMPDKQDRRVNVYAEASENSEVIWTLKADTEVEVVYADEDTGWVTVKGSGDKVGYMKDTNLSFRLTAN